MSALLMTAGYGRTTKEEFQCRMKRKIPEKSWANESTPMVIDIRATPGTINGDWCKAIALQEVTEQIGRKAYAEQGLKEYGTEKPKKHWYTLGENLWNTLDDIGIHYEWWPSMGNSFGGSLAQLMWWGMEIEYSEAFREFEDFIRRMCREGNTICLLCSERAPFDDRGRPKCHRIMLAKILQRRNPILELIHLD